MDPTRFTSTIDTWGLTFVFSSGNADTAEIESERKIFTQLVGTVQVKVAYTANPTAVGPEPSATPPRDFCETCARHACAPCPTAFFSAGIPYRYPPAETSSCGAGLAMAARRQGEGAAGWGRPLRFVGACVGALLMIATPVRSMTLEVAEGEHKCVIIAATEGSTINANYEVRRVARFASFWVGCCSVRSG